MTPCNAPPRPHNPPPYALVKFELLDSIDSHDAGRLVATKNVSMAEEYLADHFPSFPVLPGVLMLEALTQACGWVLHARSDFARSMVILREARNVRYGAFVAPGRTLRVEVELAKETPTGASFKAAGLLDGEQALAGRLEIAYFNLTDHGGPALADADERLRLHARRRWALLTHARWAPMTLAASRDGARTRTLERDGQPA